MREPAIECRQLSKVFLRPVLPLTMLQDRLLKWRKPRTQLQIPAVQDVSLTISHGEWVGLYGPNGSGKTTLLKIIAGLIPQDAGSVQMRGVPSCFFELGTGFHHDRCAYENIYIHCLLRGMSKRETKNITNKIIDLAGIRSHADLPHQCLSTGMRLRLAFAAASQIDADVYLFDEILAVGDAEFQEQCWKHLLSLKARGKTAIIVSHAMEQLTRCCDRILLLTKGKVVGEQRVSSDHPIASPSRPA